MAFKKEKIVVGLSGGIDSSMALVLLKRQGYDPIGVSFRFGEANVCCSGEALARARRLCLKLNAPYHIVDCRRKFQRRVIEHFKDSLRRGKTPNPCIVCNPLVKFANLFKFADKHHIRLTATGHYARIRKRDGNWQLLRAKDKTKDQSYFLCLLKQEDLPRILFPAGDYTKKQIYAMAQDEKLDYFTNIKQSQDLCFVEPGELPSFLKKELGVKSGQIVDTEGKALSRHSGLHFYTIGQRRGLGLAGGPWWVVGLDKKANRLIITNKEDELLSKKVVLRSFNFVSRPIPKTAVAVMAKVRFNQKLAAAVLRPSRQGVSLSFKRAQSAITPGQWAVCYRRDVCLGGGEIKGGSCERKKGRETGG